jgi:ribonuclease HI
VLTYVDDIIVKSTKQENHIADLQETFANFRQADLKLNPENCVLGVKKGKFLGYLVSTKGIEANPSKIEAILRMEPPSTMLTPPSPGAPLLLYVATSHSAVSAALVQEKLDGQVKKQAPVYFVSEVLSPSKKNYTELEKVLYAVLMASRKLRHYFQAYHIIVPSS